MKILVIGSRGMAGHIIEKYLKLQGYSVHTVARTNADYSLDIESQKSSESIKQIINLHQYDYVVNCIGLLVQDSINRPDRAIILNSWVPHYLEYLLKQEKTKLIHLSTDCVFDGKKGNYIERDAHTEVNAYGRSKSLGEINNEKDITFRMSIIGPELKKTGTGLFNWISTTNDQTIMGWENAWWNGMTTLQLAKCIEYFINNPNVSGVYHLVGDNKINKYELLVKIDNIFKLNKNITKVLGPKDINKVLVDTSRAFNYKIPDYDTQLHELYTFMK